MTLPASCHREAIKYMYPLQAKSLSLSILCSLIMCIFLLFPTPAHAGSRMTSTYDFSGTFAGSFDGRSSSVRIVVSHTSDANTAQIDMYYNEGGKIWQAFFTKNTTGSNPHILENVTLYPDVNDGRESKLWRQLYLHTWNTDWISGTNVWAGKEFGMMFVRTRSSTPPLSFSGRRMVSTKDFDGCYVGNMDGHPNGHLSLHWRGISSTNYMFSAAWRDSAGNYFMQRPDATRDDTNDANILPSLYLDPPSGSGLEAVNIVKLYLHTWDTQFVSGITNWHGINFAAAFTRYSSDRYCTV